MEISSAVSGIQASIVRQNVSAHDIANVNTPGHRNAIVHQVEAQPAGTAIGQIRQGPAPAPGFSGTDLAEEAGEQLLSKGSLRANTTALKTKDKMLGELLDIVA
jgi:flagellar basal-body rod protein FlgC